jgi:hypothetical protein
MIVVRQNESSPQPSKGEDNKTDDDEAFGNEHVLTEKTLIATKGTTTSGTWDHDEFADSNKSKVHNMFYRTTAMSLASILNQGGSFRKAKIRISSILSQSSLGPQKAKDNEGIKQRENINSFQSNGIIDVSNNKVGMAGIRISSTSKTNSVGCSFRSTLDSSCNDASHDDASDLNIHCTNIDNCKPGKNPLQPPVIHSKTISEEDPVGALHCIEGSLNKHISELLKRSVDCMKSLKKKREVYKKDLKYCIDLSNKVTTTMTLLSNKSLHLPGGRENIQDRRYHNDTKKIKNGMMALKRRILSAQEKVDFINAVVDRLSLLLKRTKSSYTDYQNSLHLERSSIKRSKMNESSVQLLIAKMTLFEIELNDLLLEVDLHLVYTTDHEEELKDQNNTYTDGQLILFLHRMIIKQRIFVL